MKSSFLIFMLVGIVWGRSILALAEERPSSTEPPALMTAEEQELRVRAKKRLYPGGQDEESLKVQAQLPTVIRRMAPATEIEVEEPATEEPAED